MNKTVVCITGASGSIYGIRLVEELSKVGDVDLVISSAGYRVIKEEIDEDRFKKIKDIATIHDEKDISSPLASGSTLCSYKGVIIAPCSMSTLGCIANGINYNLIHRIGEVALKERVKLILLVREMPYSLVHIENMLRVTKAGAIVTPASPGFYHKPKSIDDLINFVVGKIMDILGIENDLYSRWKGL